MPGLPAATPEESLRLFREWRRAELERIAETEPVSAFSRVFSLVGLDRDDDLIAELEAALEERDRVVLLIRVHPAFDGLRRDPRFLEIVERVGFPTDPSDLLRP